MAQPFGLKDKYTGQAPSFDSKSSRNFGDDHDESLQRETGVRRSYVMQDPGGRMPEVIFQEAKEPISTTGSIRPGQLVQELRNRNEAQFVSFSTSEDNVRQKFINVDSFQRTPGSRQAVQGEYNYPNKLAGNENPNLKLPNRKADSLSPTDDPNRDRASRHVYPNSLTPG